MSIRFHRGPKTITLFHDARSSVSERILRMVQAHVHPNAGTPLIRGEAKEPQQQQQQSSSSTSSTLPPPQLSPARAYLHRAATEQDREPVFLLDVVDRARATPDQWRIIASYMQQRDLDQETSESEAASGNAQQQPQHKQQHLQPPRQSEIEALKDEQGPLLVNWDDGQVYTTEAGAQTLLERLENDRSAAQPGRWCVIM